MKISNAIRTVLVGCGAVSSLYYAPAMQSLEESGLLKVVGLFDPNRNSLARLHDTFPRASCLDDIAQVVRMDVELAIIASPPQFHAAQTIQLLQAGLSVLCEKPMATSLAEGESMVKAAAAARGVLAVGLFRRFFPATQTIRDILSNGMIGELLSFYFCEGNDFKWPIASPGYFRSSECCGGVLLDIGVHALDLLSWWYGVPDEIVYEDDAMGGVEANCRVRVRFAQGFGGEIRLSRDWPLANEYLIKGTKGSVRWEVNEADKVEIRVNDNPYTLRAQLYDHDEKLSRLRRPAANFHRSFIEQLLDVATAIRFHKRPHVSGEDGLHSVKLIEHCYRYRNLMPMPWFREADYNRARQLSVIR